MSAFAQPRSVTKKTALGIKGILKPGSLFNHPKTEANRLLSVVDE
jgi:hypothetical protein